VVRLRLHLCTTVARFDGTLYRSVEPLDLSLALSEPVRTPNTVDTPTERAKHLLAQSVALPRSCGTVIGRTVAFDPKCV
jgi:hypothetical protein